MVPRVVLTKVFEKQINGLRLNLNTYCRYSLNTFFGFNIHHHANNLCVAFLLEVLFGYSVYIALEFLTGTIVNLYAETICQMQVSTILLINFL